MATDPRNVDERLDATILVALPPGGQVISVTPAGRSSFCRTFKIQVLLPDGATTQCFFQKEALATGPQGLSQMTSCFLSETATRSFIPEYVPRPLASGLCSSSRPETSFFLSEFVEMVEDNDETLPLPPPRPEHYMAPIIALHTRSMAFASQKKTEMKFGFNVDTHYGDLSQNNTWTGSWQEFFTDQMMDFLEREEMGRDIDPVRSEDRELLRLKPLFFDKVLPRYLGPLESGGREVVPCLLHADLWPWNVRYRRGGMGSDNSGGDGEEVEEKESMCLYDACVFWGHNEADLGLFRSPRRPLGQAYLDEYWKHVPISEPKEDAESRNLLYLVRNQILSSVLHPEDPTVRRIFVDNMRVLVDRVLAEEGESAQISESQGVDRYEGDDGYIRAHI